jgi:flagellin
MSRVNTNLAALQALAQLQRNTLGLNQSLERLSSGFRINRASDDPPALVISERLRTQIASLRQAAQNSEHSQNLLNTAESGLQEVTQLLISVRELVLEAANKGALSSEEIQANQAQVDAAINSINRIAGATKFGNRILLNGSLDFTASGVAASVQDLAVFGAVFGTQSQIPVKLRVTQSAQYASISRSGAGISAASSITLLITGSHGTETITFGASTGNAAIKAAVNALRDATGVSAITSTTVSGGIFFYSTALGSDAFVSVRDLDQDGNNVLWINQRDSGRDAAGTVNGIAASARGDQLQVDSATLRLRLKLAPGLNKSSASTVFTLTGGGLAFQLGDSTAATNQAAVGIQRMDASGLGNSTQGFLSQLATGQSYDLLSNPGRASQILDAALSDVNDLRGRLGAFTADTLESNIRALGITVENLTASESRLRDVDFPAETVALTRAQILVQAGTSILAQANLTPRTVLELLSPR